MKTYDNAETAVKHLQKAMNDAFIDPIWKKQFEEDLSLQIKKNMEEKLNWTTNLKNNIKTDNNENNAIIILPAYAKFVDAGRRPGKMPPISAIKKWCETKNIPQSAVYPIAFKISKVGIKPRPFIKESIAVSVVDKLVSYMTEVLQKEL